ncbi:hypothetical protein FB567DRAFT_231150 [Paraphoma chrysanthemicola]|uniref:CCR4-NOT transcription complex subunit 11 n=1 Tax=Paraphoma chrysanthemicola TaxID=798071 RepID=A0A8K0W241_9PLEO|nr:hypothetical protein FB567DRAFT_231150 [Paraphoma chrysanthemicola]
MNLSAALTADEISALNTPHNHIRAASHSFENATRSSEHGKESAFEKSIRIKNTLDLHEERACTQPDWRICALLMNCEYQLWRLNAGIPLKLNPFLSHWVETIQRLDNPDASAPDLGDGGGATTVGVINMTRTMWIKNLLDGADVGRYLAATPHQVARELLKNGQPKDFDLQVYVRMLEDEGIYEKTPEPEFNVSLPARKDIDARNAEGQKKGGAPEHSYEDEIQQHKDSILEHIQNQPDTAIFELTHLPINITYLDFLTTLLADHTLEKHAVDPAQVITQYIQHALRTVERMDKPPSPPMGGTDDAAEGEQLEYGKEAQSRHILLLLLFIKSLIRKGLVELDVLYFEIAEITVRYVWIKEVREFRSWAEEGVENSAGG